MKFLKQSLVSRSNLYIAAAIVFANVFAWAGLLLASSEPYMVEPVRDPEIVELLDYIRSGERSGETWVVTLTELEAEQTLTWYLRRYPQIPFAHPRIEITPSYVAGEGDATIAGLRVHVGGKAMVTLSDGIPQVEILELSLPVPGSIRNAIEERIQIELRRADLLPVRFSSAEWREGVVIVRGIIR